MRKRLFYKAKGTPGEQNVTYEFQTFTIATRYVEAMTANNEYPVAFVC